jgi:hypothetical protein
MNLASIGVWFHHIEPMLPLAAVIVGSVILLGCAAASWLCPSEREDCLFHRQVM